MTRKLVVAAVGGLLSAALAGCGAGLDAQTRGHLPTVPGVNVTEGDLKIRNAVVQYSPDWYQVGDDAPVEMSIYNEGLDPLRLTGVSSPAARSVTLTAVDLPGAAASPTATASPAVPGAEPSLEIPGNSLASVTLSVNGLTRPLNGTDSLPLDLSFSDGTTLSIQVPTSPPLERVPREEPVIEDGHH